jgi:hypothetical protein
MLMGREWISRWILRCDSDDRTQEDCRRQKNKKDEAPKELRPAKTD